LTLADPKSATDQDYFNVQATVGHEYFHNWTGNRITLKNWFQLSLKEGLTVFRDQEFSADMHSKAVERIKNVRNLILRQFPEDSGPMAHPVRPDSYIEMNNFYTMTVYEKGAEIIRMIQTIIGKDAFFKGMDLYFNKFDGQAVTIEDFIAVMEEASEIDLSQFKLWYSQAGTPEIKFSENYNSENNVYKLVLEQFIPNTPGQKNKKPMHIPIKIGLIDKNGKDLKTEILHLKGKKQEFIFENIKERPVLSILRNFSAPVKIKTKEDFETLAFLALNDSDEFNRWNSIQKLYKEIIFKLQNNNNNCFSLIYEPLNGIFTNAENDPLLTVKMLEIPVDTEIWNDVAVIDVEGIFNAVETLKKNIALNFEKELLKYYLKYLKFNFNNTEEAKQFRAFKNHCLYLLSHANEDKYISYAFEQFNNSDNMTDAIAALNILTHVESRERDIAFEKFYTKWRNDELVIDKWFALQAISKNKNTLNKVINLIEHELFSIKNPNRVRALIGTFCSENTINFHKTNGEGYQLLTEVIITLNELNPQIAARLASVFNRWTKFDDNRKELMKKELMRIMSLQNISNDVYEIVSKAISMENNNENSIG
jgi:aminopeptidase N